MTLHLIKLCVGISEIAELAAWQKKRLAQQRAAGVKKPVLRHLTRNTPKRAEEILDGGSLYWVIRGVVRVRQRITGIKPGKDKDGDETTAAAGHGRNQTVSAPVAQEGPGGEMRAIGRPRRVTRNDSPAAARSRSAVQRARASVR